MATLGETEKKKFGLQSGGKRLIMSVNAFLQESTERKGEGKNMNLKLDFKILGHVLMLEAVTMLIPLAAALYYGEALTPFLGTMLVCVLSGIFLSRQKTETKFYGRDGYFTVGLIWIATCLIGALPFHFSGYFPSFIDCFFESASGFTTTGSTILTDIEALPNGILLWRAFTHWLGGMGVLVLATAIMPLFEINAKYLTLAESPGPIFSKLVPKQSDTSKILYSIYISLTLLLALLLRAAGMPWFDALLHAFSTAGTGGFSNKNASIAAYDSMTIEMIIAVFMIIFSINFAIHFLLLTKRVKEAFQSDELRFFLGIVAVATLLIFVNVLGKYDSIVESFRYAFFHVAAIISTTGFSTTDWLTWPHFSQMVLIIIMFIGASAGSTGGGMKCSRILVLLRYIKREISTISHPRMVKLVKIDGQVVEEKTVDSILLFIGSYITIILVAALIISLDDYSFAVSFSSALTSMSNVGPGLEDVGPVLNHSILSPLSKLTMAITMIIGRLEIFPILVLFTPRLWKSK